MSRGGRTEPFSRTFPSLEGALGPTGLAAATQIHILQKMKKKKTKHHRVARTHKSDVPGFKRRGRDVSHAAQLGWAEAWGRPGVGPRGRGRAGRGANGL